jgi:hypothetical protein
MAEKETKTKIEEKAQKAETKVENVEPKAEEKKIIKPKEIKKAEMKNLDDSVRTGEARSS